MTWQQGPAYNLYTSLSFVTQTNRLRYTLIREELKTGQQVWLCSDASAFFDLCPCIAQADRPIEYQFFPRAAINAIITQALKLIFCPALCVPHTRFYFAIGQYL